MIYRINVYRDGKLTSTELVEVRNLQEANKLARRAAESDHGVRAEVQYMNGGTAFNTGPKRSP